MNDYSLQQRAAFFNEKCTKWPDAQLHASDRWIHGVWLLGNDYAGSGYFGAYPPGYLGRVKLLFPDAATERTLHLFSGSLPPGPYLRFDIREDLDADKHGDAHNLSSYFAKGSLDIIYADPPYSEESAVTYGKPMINRNKVLAQCAEVLCPGGFVVWLDQVLPMFRKDTLFLCGAIGVVRSTNHRFRVVSIFRRM